VNDHKLLHTV